MVKSFYAREGWVRFSGLFVFSPPRPCQLEFFPLPLIFPSLPRTNIPFTWPRTLPFCGCLSLLLVCSIILWAGYAVLVFRLERYRNGSGREAETRENMR